ncbi:RagB/SusD family nutrient uptake outer membrane protein [Larkinella bovis]|uniref:RagB/SusD family nutrient uptake outer membrane protein n=1 Tax=Larkinella bovis TaxID=683041 RepID=A0ABW0I5E2_9BACT
MNTYFKRTLLLLTLGLGSCSCTEEFLEENPVSVLNPKSFYTTETGLRQGVHAAYASLRPIYGEDAQPLYFSLFGTDQFFSGKAAVGAYLIQYDANLTSALSEVNYVWTNFYKTINLANTILANENNVTMNQEAKNQLMAEARFIRAHSYFYLTQLFGDVSLLTEPTVGLQTDFKRNPTSEIYDLIVKDLLYAEANLPAKSPQLGRLSKAAAQHQLAQVYLVLKNWKAASENALKVINSGNHRLEADYVKIFDPSNQTNSEIIWSIQYENDPINSGSAGNTAHMWFTNSYSDIPGMQRTLEWGRPWTRFAPTDYLMSMYDEKKDQRWNVWRRFDDYSYNNPASLPAGKKFGDPIDESWRGTIEFHWALKKYQDPTRPSFNETRGNKDFIVFRLGETYLLAAEALMMEGKLTEATKYFNEVRKRAARPGVDFSIKESELNIDLILDERSRELAGEANRRFDLLRTGKLVERVKKYGHPVGAANIKEMHLLMPIPQRQIDLSTSNYPQNPGY